MTKTISLSLLVASALLFDVHRVDAQTLTTSAQGQGNRSVEPWTVNNTANFGSKTTEVCVTNAAGGTTVPAASLYKRRTIELQNLGPNAIFCTVDGQAPLATGGLGRRVDALGGTWALDAGPGIALRCIAATAAQVDPACVQVTELR